MGRNRTIDRDAVLDAAMKVVARDGALGLTLDAVAAEAGISKASVLYDCKTKQALIKAIIERSMARDRAVADELRVSLDCSANACIEAHIEKAFFSVSDEERSTAMHMISAMAQDEELRAPVQRVIEERVEAIRSESDHPRGALLAFLALEGLKTLDWLGFYTWPAEDRSRLADEIRWLARQTPGNPPAKEGAP